MKKYLVLMMTAGIALGSLAACENTVHGAGEDIERAGENIQRNTTN